MKEPIKLILLRHGKTQYNIDKKFCGWTDIELGKEGEKEAEEAGALLKKNNCIFDVVYTSVLKRATSTTRIVLRAMGEEQTPVIEHWRLNERCYGALQGLRHEEMAAKYGQEQVFEWRRSYETRPPQLEKTDPRYPGNDSKYSGLKEDELPRGESLEDTVNRVMPYWKGEIIPALKSGKRVLVSASGNSLRAIVKILDNIPNDKIPLVEIPTGKPLVYELDSELRPLRHYYLEWP